MGGGSLDPPPRSSATIRPSPARVPVPAAAAVAAALGTHRSPGSPIHPRRFASQVAAQAEAVAAVAAAVAAAPTDSA